MTDVINTLTKEIERHTNKLAELEEQRKKLETELPLIKANLEALTRSLSIIQGKSGNPTPTPTLERVEEQLPLARPDNRGLREGSQSDVARSVLKENGPLRMAELFKHVEGKKPGLKFNSFTSGIYALAHKKRYFRVRSGKISLLE